MKVMLDTNILISAFIFKSLKMNRLIELLSIKCEIVICSYTIDELKGLIKNKFNVDAKKLDNFLDEFPYTLVYSPTYIDKKIVKIRDENDYIILHTAIIENVDVLITGDKDFKDIEIEKPEICTPSEFLEKYS